MMTIKDLDGNEVTVTNLEEAIKQADFFKDFCTNPPKPLTDQRAQAYWTDVYEKLMALKHNESENRP